MAAALRHRCRNPRCRLKLPAPVENEHRAFCTRGCFESFYLNRCRVCERDLRKKTGKDAGRRYCRPPNKCRAEAAQWPQKYEYGLPDTPATRPSRSADSTGLKIGIKADRRLPFRCLRGWRWTDEVDLELELHDASGQVLARLEHNRGRYRLTHPWAFPILSWADGELAKRRAESIALNALPLDPATRARVDRDNATPHPMGPPLSERICPTCRARPRSTETATPSDWNPTGRGIAPAIPAFLQRESPP
jgi:hypothetical protein